MIVTRAEFAELFEQDKPGIAVAGGPLWIPETVGPVHCEWFVETRTFSDWNTYDQMQGYWDWCISTLTGDVRCFSVDTDNNLEWWGFTDYTDIAIWLLKWAR